MKRYVKKKPENIKNACCSLTVTILQEEKKACQPHDEDDNDNLMIL